MRKLLLFSALLASLILLDFKCYAQDAGSLDLINHAKTYDGKSVIYRGEVIGDVMIRGDHAWLHVNDDTIAIGIWVNKGLIQGISYAGDYRNRGDEVEVVGIFHRSCLEHGGDLDIHAQTIKIVSAGAVIPRTVNHNKIYFGTGLFIIALLFYAKKEFFTTKE